jgi:hypothetical protein
MTKFIVFLVLLTICFTNTYGQSCDVKLVYKLLNKQLKKMDKDFDKPYFLAINTFSLVDSVPCNTPNKFISSCCDTLNEWDSQRITSKLATVQSSKSTGYMDYSCYISLPQFFGKKNNTCKITVSTHQSEWGGYSAVYSYKKIFGHWIFWKSHVYSVS